MFILSINLLDESSRSLVELRGFIASVSNDLLSDFHVGVQTPERPKSIHGMLRASPRWSEPILGFVGRALSTIDMLEANWNLPTYSALEFELRDARRGMRQVASLSLPAVEISNERALQDKRLGPWDWVRRHCLHDAYGRDVVPEGPPAIELERRFSDERSYCLLTQLPPDARYAASWLIPSSARMEVAGERHAVSPEVVEDFLCNRLEVPRPFGGWLWP